MADELDAFEGFELLIGLFLESPSIVFMLPKTNLMALCRPPGAEHFHTSPNPPLPMGAMSW